MTMIAKVIPFSSIVGGGVLLTDTEGQAIAQLSLRGLAWEGGLSGLEYAAKSAAFCERIAAAINAGQAGQQVRHFKTGVIYDVVADKALFQVSAPDDRLSMVEARAVQDGDEVTIYRNPEGMHFVRFPDEVVSPRFQEIKS